MAALFNHISKPQNYKIFFSKISRTRGALSTAVNPKPIRRPFQVRNAVTNVEAVAGFEEMVSGTQRKYYMLGGKGGVGKTSCAASLAVKFANHGHPTIVVSTDPAHSLSDSFDQDLTGGVLVPVQGVDSPLFSLEVNLKQDEFRSASQKHGGVDIKNIMDSMGLGMLADQLGDLKLGELLDTPPPGLDKAIAISKVMQFVESQEFSTFSRIVFDTAPTGHTLRLLSLPDFLDASIGKMMKLKKKIASATSAIKSVFGTGESEENSSDKLEQLRKRMAKVRDLFHDSETTEFVIVTIPTVIANLLCFIIFKFSGVESVSDCKFCSMKRKDQMRALEMIKKDSELATLTVIQSPLFDVEIRGVPALSFITIIYNNRLPDHTKIQLHKIGIGNGNGKKIT
ncbi:P-loop containing nucleoside triphosphate hydrolase superfamily protein [Forsythia ovata]|uniref:P-loop containing nucleoside triphosphate hydrolase superfamily protein n=1 Tax=Forsythia ovata TaxID=205694 RepID=A0ABD1X662_9LAMI